MMTIEIKVNGRLIAGAKVTNVSDLADISDYHVEAVEAASEVTGLPDYHDEFPIVAHERRRSVWSLVRKVASEVVASRVEAEVIAAHRKPEEVA